MTEKVTIEFEGVDKVSVVSKAVQKELGATSEKTKTLNSANATAKFSFTELSSAIGLVRQGLDLAKQAYSATVGETLKYAEQVRQLSQVSGESAESTSRFIQVLDDYKIGADDALAATKALTKNGLAPNIETLAQLSDEYLQLSSAEEKNEFILKKLGKSGLQWVEVLNKGSTAIRKQGEAVADGLILNQKQLDDARKLELAQDALGESWQQLSMTVGNAVIPALTEYIDTLNATQRATEIMNEEGVKPVVSIFNQDYREAIMKAKEEQKEATEAMIENTEAIEQNEETLKAQEDAIKKVSEQNSSFLSTLGSVDSALEAYQEGLAEANAALEAGDIKVDEHKAKVAELAAQYQEAKNQIVLSIVEMKFASEGWTDAELNAYLAVGQQLGAFTADTVRETQAVITQADLLVNEFENMGDMAYHTGERAVDAAEDFGVMGSAAADLSETVPDATAAVGGLKSQINGLPPSGSAWSYSFTINVKGRVPTLPNNSGVDGSGMCFLPGTLITLADGTHKPIEKIELGDVVRSYDTERGEFVEGRVTNFMVRTSEEYLNIDGIQVTSEHPFWVLYQGWTKAGDLHAGNELFTESGEVRTVTNISHISAATVVYNLTVEGVHNYFAGGVLVHNKASNDGDMEEHASGGVFTIPRSYGNEGFQMGGGDTASGGEKLAIAPEGKDFIDYDRLASVMPQINEKSLARAIRDALAQADW